MVLAGYAGGSIPAAFAADAGGTFGVPDYLGVLGSYVDPADRRDADYQYGGSLVAGFALNQQIAAEVRAFAVGLQRDRGGRPYILGAGANVRASERHGFFLSGGAGLEHGSVDDSHRSSPYVEIGAGYQRHLLPRLSLRLETSYRLLANLGSSGGSDGGFGGELWAGAGLVLDGPRKRHATVAAQPPESLKVVPVQCPPVLDGLLTDADGVLVAQDSRAIPIGFATASAALDDTARAPIAQLAAALRCGAAQQLAIQVVGHADDRGDAVYNVQLSQRRANAVREGLMADGIDGDRIGVAGEGRYEPLESGSDAAAYAANRRIQITLYPGVTPQ